MGGGGSTLLLTPLVSDTMQSSAQPITLYIPLKDMCKHGDESSLAEEINRFFESGKDSILLIPGKKNQTTFDALSILKSGTINIFQITVGKSHSIMASGLDLIWNAVQKSNTIATLSHPAQISGGWCFAHRNESRTNGKDHSVSTIRRRNLNVSGTRVLISVV